MDTERKPKKELADELECLRAEIAQLQSLIQSPEIEIQPPPASRAAEAVEEVSFPPRLLDHGHLGMALVDTHFRITKANAAFRRMLGYSEHEIKSLHIQDLAEDSGSCTQVITQIFEGISPVSKTEVEFFHRNGKIRRAV
jgi:PAS domain-containing protein